MTLTIYGPGTLNVNGADGEEGECNHDGGNGGNGTDGKPAITGNVIIYSGIVTANGGYGGNGGYGHPDNGDGANGANAFTGSVTIYGGNVTAKGGNGGDTFGNPANAFSGSVTIYGGNVTATGGVDALGGNASAFASAPTIKAKKYTMTNGEETITSTEEQWKVVIQSADYDPNAIDVTINDAQTEATFEMPTFNTLVSYELVRDMSIQMTAEVAERIRIELNSYGNYVPVEEGGMDITVTDGIENEVLTLDDDYTKQLQKKGEGDDEWTDVTALSLGLFRYKITGTGNYDGTCYSNEFKLFQGYEVEVEAGGFATYFKDEALTIDESTEGAELYTVSEVTDDKAVLSSAITIAPASTPLLVYNTTEETKTFLLIPTDDTADENVTPADEFKGTLAALEMPASTAEVNYYVCDGTQFVWVKNAGTIAANRCWLQIGNGEPISVRAIVFSDEATGIEELTTSDSNTSIYDISGRKVSKARKGVYIINGKKVVVK